MWTLNAVDPWGRGWTVASVDHRPPQAPEFRDPISLLQTAMRQHRVVVLQERHDLPETQAFGAHLIPVLRAAGATHLAFETPAQRPLDRFARSGSVRADTVVYGFAPFRAAILRAARDAGLRLAAFDRPLGLKARLDARRLSRDPAGLNQAREEWMARNVADLLRRLPAARVIVWTGEQHAMKRTPPWWRPSRHPFMAAHLQRLCGEPVFCVGQWVTDAPVVQHRPLATVDAVPLRTDRGLDAMIFHHRGAEPSPPPWLAEATGSISVAARGASLIQIRSADEGDHAVPVDLRLVTAESPPPVFHLPQGWYRAVGVDAQDTPVWWEGVAVDPHAR